MILSFSFWLFMYVHDCKIIIFLLFLYVYSYCIWHVFKELSSCSLVAHGWPLYAILISHGSRNMHEIIFTLLDCTKGLSVMNMSLLYCKYQTNLCLKSNTCCWKSIFRNIQKLCNHHRVKCIQYNVNTLQNKHFKWK